MTAEHSPETSLTFLDCAERVLREFADGRPMHYKEIAERALERGWLETEGKTPAATMGAQIYAEIKSRREEGKAQRFVLHGPGLFSMKGESDRKRKLPDTNEGGSKKGTAAGARLTFLESTERVLRELAAGQPMHYKEITRKAQEAGWLVSEGKSPWNTVFSVISTDIRKRQKRGEPQRFVQHGRGFFSLAGGKDEGLIRRIEQHNTLIRERLRERLGVMQPSEFEELVSLLLVEMGFESVEVTKASGDGGIDVRGVLVVGDVVRIRMAVQVKRWKNNVQTPTVQQVRGSLSTHEQGLIITTSGFSRGARTEAELPDRSPIALMDGDQLVRLLMEHGLGVIREPRVLFAIDESFAWEEVGGAR